MASINLWVISKDSKNLCCLACTVRQLEYINIMRMVHSLINAKVILQTVTTSLNDVETSSWIEHLLFGNIPEGGFYKRLGIIIELSWAERCVVVSIEHQQKMSSC